MPYASARTRATAPGPGRRRMLFLDIEGHHRADGGVDADMCELQQDFLLGVLAPCVSEVQCPLATLRNPRPQDDDIPSAVVLTEGARPGIMADGPQDARRW